MTPDAQNSSSSHRFVARCTGFFMRTEFDRYFLQIIGDKVITKSFSKKMVAIMGLKTFSPLKSSVKTDIDTLLELFPFMFGYKGGAIT